MSAELAKEAAEARAELAAILTTTAMALAQSATVLNECSLALTAAIEREAQATEAYVTSLQAALSRQQALS